MTLPVLIGVRMQPSRPDGLQYIRILRLQGQPIDMRRSILSRVGRKTGAESRGVLL
jgi:hypothetical protein